MKTKPRVTYVDVIFWPCERSNPHGAQSVRRVNLVVFDLRLFFASPGRVAGSGRH